MLGSLLFLIYSNDPMGCYNGIYVFADDAKIYCLIHCIEDCKLLQHAVTNLQSWSQKWLLSLNNKKCCVVSYGSSVD